MQFRRQSREALQINLTPLIDVVFLLLIFFMVSTNFNRETQLQVNLPTAQSGVESEDSDVLDIGISQDGTISIDGQNLITREFDMVVGALRQAAHGEDNPRLIISADGMAPHQALIRVMDAAASLGYSRIALAAQREEH
jgi:biopolymer transport protein ExbD